MWVPKYGGIEQQAPLSATNNNNTVYKGNNTNNTKIIQRQAKPQAAFMQQEFI